MHDGQNLFDKATAGYGMEWEIDEHLDRLIRAKQVRPTIVVGIWNTPKRFEEYMPAKALAEAAALPDGWPDMAWMRQQKVVSDDYLRFIVEELKPWVDSTYRTLPGRDDTSIMGSSMGALISLYAIAEYPDVFGGAGCVSIHWPLGDGIVADWFARHLPPREGHRIYFDYGTATLDAAYGPYQRRVDAMLTAAGWRPGTDFLSRRYEGAEHSERAWRARLPVPLGYLLGPPAQNR
jgi:predicted alpha/beta superfamily hydrolase